MAPNKTPRWRQTLLDSLPEGTWAAHLSRLGRHDGPPPWPWADGLELAGLERWGTALAKADRRAGVAALVAAAQHGFPAVVAAGGADIQGCGFTGDDRDRIVDGAAVEVQLRRAGRWVGDPSVANKAAVQEAFDRTRQLHVWEPDLRPAPDASYWWYQEVGQAACAAILNGRGSASADSYYKWPPAVCVGRGLVLSVLGLRKPRGRVGPLVEAAGRAIAAAATA